MQEPAELQDLTAPTAIAPGELEGDLPTPPPPSPLHWHQRPLGLIALTIGILLGSWAAAWAARSVAWYAWSVAMRYELLTHADSVAAFGASPTVMIVNFLAMDVAAVVLALVVVQARRPHLPRPAELWVARPSVRPALWPVIVLGSFGVEFAWGYFFALLRYVGLVPNGAPLHDAMFTQLHGFTGAGAVLTVLALSLGAGISEEVVCRGYLLKGLAKSWPAGRAIIVSSIVFAAAHLDFSYMIGVFPIGLWLGYVAYRTRSIVLTILTHAVIDLYALGGIAVGRDALSHPLLALLAWGLLIGGCLCILPSVFILERSARPTTTTATPT